MLSLEVLKNVFDAIDVGVTVTNEVGDIIYVNAAQLKRSYYTYQDYMRLNSRELYRTGVSDTCLFDIATSTRKPVTAIQRTYHKADNSSYEKLVTATPLFDADGNITNVVTTYIDLEIFRGKYSQALLSKEITLRSTVVEPHRDLIYRSQAMHNLLNTALSVADTDTSILLTGESGTGKEVVATFIHDKSKRGGGTLVAINCASLPENLLEAELFGYEKGAFTGAAAGGKLGLIESAENGTLFLDEVNSLPLALQGKLLRVLETKKVKRIGSIKEHVIDFRIIAATNADLAQCVSNGTFRMDLFYRLNVIPLVIPPLRQRRDDIVPLCKFFLQKYFERYGKLKILSNQAFETLKAYDWPGNVRELKNFIERLVVAGLFPDPYINTISPELFGQPYALVDQSAAPETPDAGELRRIVNALKENQGNRVKAAEYLGISRRTLQYKLKKYRIETRLEPKVYVNSNLY